MMNNYLYSLLIVSLIGGIVNSLVDSCKNLKHYINYYLSLVMVICMISPVMAVFNNISEYKENISNFVENIIDNDSLNGTNEIIINTGTDVIIKGIKNSLIDKFGFDEKELIVELETDKTNIEAIRIKKINIILTGKSSWSDVDSVKNYLDNIVGGDISVTRR